jgi:hypothetical protein
MRANGINPSPSIGTPEPRSAFNEGVTMATHEQLRDLVPAQPLRPYVITLADGRTFTIRHPELVSCDAKGRDLQVNTDDGLVRVEMLLVTCIHQLQ